MQNTHHMLVVLNRVQCGFTNTFWQLKNLLSKDVERFVQTVLGISKLKYS